MVTDISKPLRDKYLLSALALAPLVVIGLFAAVFVIGLLPAGGFVVCRLFGFPDPYP